MAKSEESGKDHQDLVFGSWEELAVGGTAPSKRFGHACAVVGSRMYSFGGATNSEDDDTTVYYNDLFLLDFGERPLCWKRLEQHGDIPSAREGSTLTAINDDLYLYGGVDKEGTFTCAEGLYVFNTGTCTWKLSPTTGHAPTAQSLSAVAVGNDLVTFGGVLNGQPKNTTHSLDIATMEWSEVETSGSPPSPRCDHASCVVGGRVYVTAGSGGENVWFNDVFSLDLPSKTWSPLDVQGATPTPRDYTSLSSLANAYLIGFGGFTGCRGDDECLSELSYIDLASQKLTWTRVDRESLSPPPRYGHSAVVHDNKLYLFAGQDTEREFNDIWTIPITVPMLGFEPTPVPKPRYSTATPIPAPRKTVTPAPPPEVKPRDFEELRATYLKRINEMFDTLSERFLQLDNDMATLSSERSAFEAEKKAHQELYERQQEELKEQLSAHERENEEWLEKTRGENDRERRRLAEERATLDRANSDLAREQVLFQSKSKKLDAIMKQVQGLSV